MRLSTICEDSLSVRSDIEHCSTCGSAHKYIIIIYHGVDVALVKRQCNGNTRSPLGWTVEFSANAYRNYENKHSDMAMLQSFGQGKAPFPTWKEAVQALSEFFGKVIDIPEVRRTDAKHIDGIQTPVIIVSQTANTVRVKIRDKVYEYTTSPFVLRKFFGIYKFSPMKAVNFIKARADHSSVV
jgi:hypothetical protein